MEWKAQCCCCFITRFILKQKKKFLNESHLESKSYGGFSRSVRKGATTNDYFSSRQHDTRFCSVYLVCWYLEFGEREGEGSNAAQLREINICARVSKDTARMVWDRFSDAQCRIRDRTRIRVRAQHRAFHVERGNSSIGFTVRKSIRYDTSWPYLRPICIWFAMKIV